MEGALTMRKSLLVLGILILGSMLHAAPADAPAGWRAKVAETMPLLGHRNWILIVDSAYPLQASDGIETIETNASQSQVIRYVLAAIDRSIHVRPLIYMDAELPYVPEQDAPGATAYRYEIKQLFRDFPIEQLPHERIISTVDETSKQFHILVLKTNMAIPYTSVFIRLDCKYWSADAEARMRAKMNSGEPAPK
jgi:hypothetical protein